MAYKSPNKPTKKGVVPVGNVAPWTSSVGLGGGTSSSANKKRTYKKPTKKGKKKVKKTQVVNRAPRARVPNIGNTNNGGWTLGM